MHCMSGCKVDEETSDVVTLQQCGYNGEDFIKLDLKNLTWIVQNPLAATFKPWWDADKSRLNATEVFLPLTCPEMLMKFVNRSALQREDITSVHLLQKTPSSLVSCFATGFYPKSAEMFWRRDGEELQDNAEPSETVPNHDNTYQRSIYLNVTSIDSEDWKRYECMFKLSNNTIIKRLEKTAISTNFVSDPESSSPESESDSESDSEFPLDLAIGLVVGLILLCICISGLFLWKNTKNASHFPDTRPYPIYAGTIQNSKHNFEIQ